MAQISSSGKTWVAFLVLAIGMVCVLNYHQANSASVDGACGRGRPNDVDVDEEAEELSAGASENQEPWDGGLTMLPYVAECGPDEKSQPGQHPSCEPSCANPRPVCIKIYFQDYVPCFCKAPLVRDTQSKRCVPLSECPTGRTRN